VSTAAPSPQCDGAASTDDPGPTIAARSPVCDAIASTDGQECAVRTVRKESVDFVDRAPVRAVAERDVSAPPERVWEVLADAPSWTEWFPAVRECRYTSGSGGVGSTRTVRVGPVRFEEEFIVWDEPTSWGFTIMSTSLPVVAAAIELVELTPVSDDGTHVRYAQAVEPIGLGKLIFARGARAAQRGIASGLDGLDAYLRRSA
jgi:uncharacterized protein YndB with AHSA1/START domain